MAKCCCCGHEWPDDMKYEEIHDFTFTPKKGFLPEGSHIFDKYDIKICPECPEKVRKSVEEDIDLGR